MRVNLCDAEMDALAGMPLSHRWVYVFCLRQFMDYATGIVGLSRRISYQAISEALYIEPHQGLAESGSPSKPKIQRIISGLCRAGLIEPTGEKGSLVFFCPLAETDESAKNKPDTKSIHLSTLKDKEENELIHSEPDTPPLIPLLRKGNPYTRAREPRKKRKAAIPDDFPLTDDLACYARAKGIDDHRRIADWHEGFCLSARSGGYQYSDWSAAWKNWLRRDIDSGKFNAQRSRTDEGRRSTLADRADAERERAYRIAADKRAAGDDA